MWNDYFLSWHPQTIQEQLKKINDIKGFQAEGNSKQKHGTFVGDKEALG